MNLSHAIDFLLENAGASIRYRIRKEICKESVNSDEMQKLQAQILALPKIKKAFSGQKEDGFIGNVIHGVYFYGFDSTVELLKRYGVEIAHPDMQRAKESLLHWTDYESDSFYKSGNAMDEHGRGGFRAVWADVLIELGADETTPVIQEQINKALNAFRGALHYSCMDDFTKKATFQGKKCRYYIKGATFPAANHVTVLEKTLSWRNKENLAMVQKSFLHCQELMKGHEEGTLYVNCGYFVGPFNYNWKTAFTFPESIHDFDAQPIDFAWFMRGMSTAAVRYPIFKDKESGISTVLEEWLSDDSFISTISSEQMRNFKNYASIEQSWRKKESVACDIYFPLVLTLGKRK